MSTHEIKNDIWNLLLSKGFKISTHSAKILHHPEQAIKYRFGKNNLQKFRGGIKVASVPFSRLEIKDGKITKKTQKIKILGSEIEVK